jgi:ubiquinone/menaquinone biosynthesis C-methylase UbiE
VPAPVREHVKTGLRALGLRDWVGSVMPAATQEDGVFIFSPPQNFEGGEENYDLHIGGAARADLFRSGQGAWKLVRRHAARPVASMLEIGAGGGTCSLGLVQAAGSAKLVVTDTSPKFLRMIGGKLNAAGLDQRNIRFATLAGEDMVRLRTASLDAIVIASALHHVGDWVEFLRQAARTLRRGGVLVIQEPFREGNLMMAMCLDIVLSPLWPQAAALPAEDMEILRRCRDSIYFLANSSIVKVGEDKHNFLLADLNGAALVAGFQSTAFYSNAHFDNLADAELAGHRGICSFAAYLDSFLVHHHRVSAAGMALLRQHLLPVLDRLDGAFRAGDGAPLFGCMVFTR